MSPSTSDDLPIVVVGGGIGGVAAALALARVGRTVEVFEQADDLREIGAGIQMPPNAFRAFEALGVLEAMQAVAAYPQRLVLGDLLSGKVVYEVPIDDDFVRRFGFRYALLHRGDVLERLVEECRKHERITLRPSSRVTGFQDVGDRVVVTLANGESHEGAALIGSDGLWSMTRATLLGEEKPRTDGYVLSRGVVPVSKIPEELYSQSVTMWGGPGLDFFHYPLRRDEIFNIGASYHDPNVQPGPDYPKGSSEALAHHFRDACPHVKELLKHVDVSRTWLLHDRIPVANWSKGRVTLLGDAAHPTSVYISQGACMALEDAVALAEKIDRIGDMQEALRAYERARYLRTARIQLTSRQFGEIYHASGVHRDLRNTLLAKASPKALYDVLGWVFSGERIEPEQAAM
jgi:3-hydroxybenzoate 6-monooxygenase